MRKYTAKECRCWADYPNTAYRKLNGSWKCIDCYELVKQGSWKHKTRCKLKESDSGMTKEEAINIIKSECYTANLLNLDRTRMVNTALDTVIEAAEKTRWIPLNAEGNEPEKDGIYLVCFENGYISTIWHYNNGWLIEGDKPIAYMPLPTPYKAEGSDKE